VLNTMKCEEKFKKHKYELIAIGVTLLWLLVCLASKMVEETNDDIAIAFMIAHSPEHLCPFVHPAYSKLLGIFFDWIPQINWWSVFSLFGITIAAYVFSCMSLKKFDGVKKWIAIAAVLSLIYVAAIDQFNFTRTAGVISLAGAVRMVDCICDQTKKTISKILKGVSAVVLLLWGISVRSESFFLCIPFCVGYFAAKELLSSDQNKRMFCFKKHWLKRAGILTAILFAVFAFEQAGDCWLKSDPAWAEYIRFNKARALVSDYCGLPEYKGHEAEYSAIDVSELDLEMVGYWITENPDSITTEKMVALAELSDAQVDWKTAAYTVYRMRDRLVFIIAAFIVLVCILSGRLMDWLYIGCISAGAAAVAVYISKQGRFPARVFDVICLNVAITSLMGSLGGNILSQRLKQRLGKGWSARIGAVLEKTVIALVLAAACAYIVHGFSGSAWYWERWNRSMQRARQIEEQDDRVYILPVGSPLASNKQAYGLWSMPHHGASRNIFYLGGWEQRAPYMLQIREQQGVSNLFTALVEKPNVYSTAEEPMQEWLSKYYQGNITVSTVDEKDDIEIIQYSKPIAAENMSGNEKQFDMFMSESENPDHSFIRIYTDMNEFKQYDDVRLNFSTPNGLRTFKMQRHEDGFSAKLHESHENLGENAFLIGLNQEGIYEKTGVLRICLNGQ